jgi:hypothetical protein
MLGLIGSAAGFYLARSHATARRQWLAYIPSEDRWKAGYFRPSIQRRWVTRTIWGFAAWIASSIVGPWFPVELALWWSVGWLAGEFTDKASAAGVIEWEQWRTDDERWRNEHQRARETEYGWASAFPDHSTYTAAWENREFGPLDQLEFAAAKEGHKPEMPAPAI